MTNLRDTEDGINEAGWEKAMTECGKTTHGGFICTLEVGHKDVCQPLERKYTKRMLVEDCEKCGATVLETVTVSKAASWSEPGYDEQWCHKCAKFGSFDPENRDWDRERDEQDGF